MAHYKGAASEGARAAALLKKREQGRENLEFMKKKITESATRIATIQSRFSTQFDFVERELRDNTIGLVTLEQMKQKREHILQERERQIATQTAARAVLDKRKERDNKRKKTTISFDLDEEEDDEDDHDSPSKPTVETVTFKKPKFGKDPDVETSFLPDRDREEEERRERDRLRLEWVEKQETIKREIIEITYSYWDGSGHRRTIQVNKGNTIQHFLQKCLENLRKEFNELKTTTVDNLMYIKEDLIIPHHMSFYDFIVRKIRGKSGPLFTFDVHEDVRLINDASVEKDESHAGKVVLRHWYERNKHIFPASRWEPYDPEKSYDRYTISDKKSN
ncbi:uncharacterized protein TRIADDRAFT_28870 [Trichoplax adhaerens]|uniref:FAM50A/XAP5 C-terminal domain-containing protein n=1 Tax=Trichoplax adhaerens TaxID=10228 RepID=B3S3V0_TRIAD|nr:hypothetical protein TRIADDRAFT_28870 [Trichoplax adhaerens]EDV22348.1 hypothetical protein TRIADDRAFT_28870 [Trichoplax adhaerens]|eukprot:XP_002114892.1 hypothetical protein TRIADDRAFT_28870 [Trichoplax adhaerens]